MRFRSLMVVAALGMTLVGCQYNATVTTSDPELNQQAEALFGEFVKGDDAAVAARMSSDNDVAEVKAQMPMLRRMVEHETAPEPRVEDARKTTSNAGASYSVAQAYDYPDRQVMATTDFIKEGDVWKVQGFNINVRMKAQAGPGAGAVEAAGEPQS